MASRSFKPAPKVLNTGAVDLCGKWTVGTSGAVGTTSLKGIDSVTLHGSTAGHYTLALSDTYANLISGHITVLHAASGVADQYFYFESEDVDHATSPNVVVTFYTGGGTTAAHPPSGTTVMVDLHLSNSKLGIA